MNNFATSDEQSMLVDNLGRLLADVNEFSKRRARLAGSAPDRLALWAQLADQGMIAGAFGEDRGGLAGDARTIAVIMSSLGAALAVEPYLAAAVVAGRVLQRRSDRSAAQPLIDEVVAGQHICVLAHNPDTDPFQPPTPTAIPGDGGMLLSGLIPLVRHGELAHSFIVPARLADESVGIFHIPREQPGLELQAFRLIDAAGAAALRFDKAVVSPAARMMFDIPGRAVLNEALEWGILGIAAESAGIVHALNHITFAYLVTRKQFGAALASFQALQHRAADMWIAAEELSAVVELGIGMMATGDSAARSAVVSAMKVVSDEAGRRIGNDAVQLHGGMGVSDELIVSHYFRRLAAIRGEFGSDDAHRLRFRSMQ